jgi:hypothetical protein
MSEQNQITVFVILAFIGGVTAVIYGIKLFFWILLLSMTHPVETICAWVMLGLFIYAMNKK